MKIMARCIGLTGGIASGKSQVRKLFEEKSFKTLSADEVVHSLMKKGQKAYDEILQKFGVDILDKNQEIDRKALGELVFKDKKLLRCLEEILHPEVKKTFDNWQKQNAGEDWIVYEIPLLFEKNREEDFDLIYCVSVSSERQIERIMKRDSISLEQAKARVKNQIPQEQKMAKSDIVLKNDFDDLDELKKAFLKTLDLINAPKNNQS
ncbi:MAG: dephospho-CoA kinase [Bdellovibrionaceae bacterium]|nr:dephospho-CoA kinase [Pseudobdellovibrionaceae bacterium]|tara:strand:+ start:15766 stop:16386 length:621 start_codon:yes stop_codon:yes gene_type:complete